MPEFLRYLPEHSIEIGAKVPDFILVDQEDRSIRLKDLAGSPAVLYFYPMDGTEGCTKEACDFRDIYDDFKELDCVIYGISPDDKTSHASFSDEHGLPFQLCVDPDNAMIKDFGVWGEYQLADQEIEPVKIIGLQPDLENRINMVVRSTFLIDKNGLLVQKWMKVSFRGHASSVKDQLHKSFKFDIAF